MKKRILFILLAATFILFYCSPDQGKGGLSAEISQDSLVKRGDYLVSTSGCDDCHTPKKFGPNGPVFDMDRRLSGHPPDAPVGRLDSNIIKSGWILMGMDITSFIGPWGTSYAANLTSDPTGTGNWTEEQFFTALRKGKYKGLEEGRSLLPPMPWEVYGKMNDMDIKAIFAYLKTTKPISNVVPTPRPPGEF